MLSFKAQPMPTSMVCAMLSRRFIQAVAAVKLNPGFRGPHRQMPSGYWLVDVSGVAQGIPTGWSQYPIVVVAARK